MDLPPDLLREILSTLPVKSLLRFRCVSKAWRALVDDDADFAQQHLNTFKNNSDETCLLVMEHPDLRWKECVVRCSDTYERISKIPNIPASHVVVSSLHGLIVLRDKDIETREFSPLKVWNPSIRSLLTVPPLLKPEVYDSGSVTDKDIGLGYDQVAKSYNHVKLVFVHGTLHSVAVYTLGDHSWKIKDFQDQGFRWSFYEPQFGCVFNTGVYFKSSLYFISSDENLSWGLVRFDLNKEVFSSTSMHGDLDSNSGCRRLAWAGGGFVVEEFDQVSSVMRVSAVDYSIFHIKKNGDMLTWRNFWGEVETSPFNRIVWDELMSYSRKTENRIGEHYWVDYFISHVSCYVESLIRSPHFVTNSGGGPSSKATTRGTVTSAEELTNIIKKVSLHYNDIYDDYVSTRFRLS